MYLHKHLRWLPREDIELYGIVGVVRRVLLRAPSFPRIIFQFYTQWLYITVNTLPNNTLNYGAALLHIPSTSGGGCDDGQSDIHKIQKLS